MDSSTDTHSKQARLFVWPRVRHLVWRAVSAWGLVMTNDQSLSRWEPLVLEALRCRYRSNLRTADKVEAEARRLLRYLQARGAVGWGEVTSELVSEWCWASRLNRSGVHQRTSPATARNRQWAATAVFTEAAGLGAPIDPTALIGSRIERIPETASTRPLTAAEAMRVRDFADAGLIASRRSLLVAFAFAGGTATEIAGLRMENVDTTKRTVTFAGNAARVNHLDGWGLSTVEKFLRANPSLAPWSRLCVTEQPSTAQAAHSVTVRLGHVLRDAGLAQRQGVTARSIRLATANYAPAKPARIGLETTCSSPGPNPTP